MGRILKNRERIAAAAQRAKARVATRIATQGKRELPRGSRL